MMQTHDTKNLFCSIHNERQPRTPHVANEPQVSYQRASNYNPKRLKDNLTPFAAKAGQTLEVDWGLGKPIANHQIQN